MVQLFYAARLATLFTGALQKALVAGVTVLALAQLGGCRFRTGRKRCGNCAHINFTAFGIVATYYTSKLPSTTDIFKLSIQNQVAWTTLAGLLCSVLCVSPI